MLSRDLGHLLLCSLRFVSVLWGARRGLGIPKYSLTSADKGPITSLIQRTMFLVMHPNIKLAFIYLFTFFAAVVYCKFSFDSNANYLIFGMLNHLSFKLFMWCSVYLHPNCRSLHLFFITDSYRTNKRPALITILLISDSEKQCFPDPPGFESHQWICYSLPAIMVDIVLAFRKLELWSVGFLGKTQDVTIHKMSH